MALCTLAGLLACWSAPTRAAVIHPYVAQITEVPAASGSLFTGPLESVDAMTVDSGILYVAEGLGESSRLNKFDASSGAFLAQFPHVPSLEYLDQGVAVDHVTGEVYVGGDELVEGSPNGVVAAFSPSGSLEKVWKGADTPDGGFGCFECGPRGAVAFDGSTSLADWASGDVYVASPAHNVVDVFKPLANGGEEYLTQLTGPEPGVPFAQPSGVAVDPTNGDVVVIEPEAVDIFEPTALNEYVLLRRLTATPQGALRGVSAVAVDSSGDVYISQNAEAGANALTVSEFSATGAYLGRLAGTPQAPFERPQSVAVDATGRVYVGDQRAGGGVVDSFETGLVAPDVVTEAASSVKHASATLNGTVNPDNAGAAACRFEYGTGPGLGASVPCSAPVANGASPVAVQASLVGLKADTTYQYRLQASNANGTNPGEALQNHEFTTPGPGLHDQSVSSVTATSATLNARIDPNGAPTSYYFQYGTSSAYGSDVPAAPGVGIGAGSADLPASVHLQGLTPSTVYHYRVVAVSEPGGEPVSEAGADQTFTTQAANTQLTLPDGRAWELVSPPNKQGAGIVPLGDENGGADMQAAAGGGGITYEASAPFVENPAGSRTPEVAQVISTRRAPASWESADITTADNNGVSLAGVGHLAEYKLFSSDLSVGLVEPNGDTPLPPLPAGAEKTFYVRLANGEYRAVVSSENVVTGAKFGGLGAQGVGGVRFVSATPDLSHIVLTSLVRLTSSLTPPGESLLYEWAGGQLRLASVLPGGEASAHAALGDSSQNVRHAISNDGSHVIFEAAREGESTGHLYLRDMTRSSTGETIRVDAAQGTSEPVIGEPSIFATANGDGSRVFFTGDRRLTGDSTARAGTRDLYVFDLTSGAGEALAGTLADLTVDGNAGESAGVRGVIGASEDGSSVYFVAKGVLGDGAGRGAERGGANLYVEHHDAATRAWMAPRFIAALSTADANSWGGDSSSLYLMTSRVSPDGRYLAFMSDRSLTGYDNRDASSGVPDEEVFLYNSATGRLACASCNPTGARPAGLLDHSLTAGAGSLIDSVGLWDGRWLAANVPGWTPFHQAVALYQSRYLSDGGRLFFNSSDALVPGDVNGAEDVYEFEPAGVGGCQPPGYGQSASVVFSAAMGGCVGLISAGRSSEDSAFMDASESGGDVFFMTLSRLSAQDYDTSFDMYDAHECAPAAPCAPQGASVPAPCVTGDACKPAPTPQPAFFGAPSSETFSGAGNVGLSLPSGSRAAKSLTRAQKLARALKACQKRSKGKRAACRRQARRRYAARAAGSRSSAGSGR